MRDSIVLFPLREFSFTDDVPFLASAPGSPTVFCSLSTRFPSFLTGHLGHPFCPGQPAARRKPAFLSFSSDVQPVRSSRFGVPPINALVSLSPSFPKILKRGVSEAWRAASYSLNPSPLTPFTFRFYFFQQSMTTPPLLHALFLQGARPTCVPSSRAADFPPFRQAHDENNPLSFFSPRCAEFVHSSSGR